MNRGRSVQGDAIDRGRAEAADLRQRVHQQQAIAELGQRALAGGDLFALLDEGAFLAGRTLGVAYGAVFERETDSDMLRLRAGTGWADHAIGRECFAARRDTQIGYTLLTREPVVVTGPNDPRAFVEPELLRQHQIRCGMSVVIHGVPAPYGVLSVHGREPRLFSVDDLHFLQAVANMLAVAIGRQHAQDALQGSERRFRALIEHSLDAVALLDEEGRFIYASPTSSQILGIAVDDLIGRSSLDLVHPDDRARDTDLFAQLMRTPGMKTHTLSRVRRSDGSWRWIESINHSLFADQNVRALVTNYRDVTERKHADERTAALLEVSRIMSGTIERQDLLDRVQERLATLLPCEAVVTFYADTADDVFRMVAHHGVPRSLLPEAQQLVFRRGVPFGGRVSGGETLVINDVRDQPWLPADLYARFGITAAVASPLRVHGRELGTMVAFRRVAGAQFDTAQVDLFGGIAQQLAVALESVELYQAQQEEAEVASALARVGRELISSLDQPGLLDRLCRLTAEVLGCDCTHTFLWRRDEDVFVPVSSHGDTPEMWEAIRVLRIPRALGVGLLARLEHTDAVRADVVTAGDLFAPHLAQTFGITAGLVIALRRGDDIIGIQTAGYRGGDRPFTPRHERIARGIAQLASMALHNARLLDELTQASQVKSEFVATMSHELRTPLHIILGYNALLLEGALGELSGEQGDALRRIDRNARELFDLVNAMLDLSRLEAGKLPVRPTDVDLAAFVDELDSEIREFHLQKPAVEFEWQIAAGLPRLFTDPVKLKVVIKNLVRNALKFTDRGRVTVLLRGQDRGVAITVSDTGIGIAPEARAVIFEPFRQANSAIGRDHGGAGLGLYIVRRLLETLGGVIELDSELGRGSTFHIWLPERCDTRAH